jgi:hypothetical protein
LNDDYTPMEFVVDAIEQFFEWIAKVQYISCSAFIMKESPSAELAGIK